MLIDCSHFYPGLMTPSTQFWLKSVPVSIKFPFFLVTETVVLMVSNVG